jgi:hypothetical protein
MSHTHKNQRNKFDDDFKGKRKHPNHANNHKTGGMKIINQNIFEEIEEVLYNDDKYDYEQHSK